MGTVSCSSGWMPRKLTRRASTKARLGQFHLGDQQRPPDSLSHPPSRSPACASRPRPPAQSSSSVCQAQIGKSQTVKLFYPHYKFSRKPPHDDKISSACPGERGFRPRLGCLNALSSSAKSVLAKISISTPISRSASCSSPKSARQSTTRGSRTTILTSGIRNWATARMR